MFSETKITEIYCMTDDFCKEIAQFQEKYMVEDKDIELIDIKVKSAQVYAEQIFGEI